MAGVIQEQKLQGEIENLNAQLRERDEFIQSRKAILASLENNISQSNEGFITLKGVRDKLQDERKLVLIPASNSFCLFYYIFLFSGLMLSISN